VKVAAVVFTECFAAFQGIFVGDVGDIVAEAPVAADSSLSRHVSDGHQSRSVLPLCILYTVNDTKTWHF